MPAATRAPKASTRTTSVTGSESMPARSRSLPTAFVISSSAVVSPKPPTKRSGLAALAFSTARTIGAILSSAASGSPRMSNRTTAERPSAEICSALPGSSGLRILVATFVVETRATTSSTAAAKVGLFTVSVSLWTRTLSSAGETKPSSRIVAIRPDSPGAPSSSMCFVPIAPPIATAATTNAIHPAVAVFQCAALQRPVRAARFSLMTRSSPSLATCIEAARAPKPGQWRHPASDPGANPLLGGAVYCGRRGPSSETAGRVLE